MCAFDKLSCVSDRMSFRILAAQGLHYEVVRLGGCEALAPPGSGKRGEPKGEKESIKGLKQKIGGRNYVDSGNENE